MSAISDCYALNVDADTAWTCCYTGFPIIRNGELTGWDGAGGVDHDRLVAGQLTDNQMRGTE
ncbi:hypothetical protein ACQEU6_30045 [Spirillospora sp. CA-108201]